MKILLPADVLKIIDELRGEKSRVEFICDIIVYVIRNKK